MLPPSRVGVVGQSFLRRDFLTGLPASLLRPEDRQLRRSMILKWRFFSLIGVCSGNWSAPPLCLRSSRFLRLPFQDRKCSPSTIKGYRSAISSALNSALVEPGILVQMFASQNLPNTSTGLVQSLELSFLRGTCSLRSLVTDQSSLRAYVLCLALELFY